MTEPGRIRGRGRIISPPHRWSALRDGQRVIGSCCVRAATPLSFEKECQLHSLYSFQPYKLLYQYQQLSAVYQYFLDHYCSFPYINPRFSTSHNHLPFVEPPGRGVNEPNPGTQPLNPNVGKEASSRERAALEPLSTQWQGSKSQAPIDNQQLLQAESTKLRPSTWLPSTTTNHQHGRFKRSCSKVQV